MRGEPVPKTELFLGNANRPAGVCVSVTGSPMKDEYGVAMGGVVVFRDVT